jgi:antirestriction protein
MATTIHAGDSTTGCAVCTEAEIQTAIEEAGHEFGAVKAYAEYIYGCTLANWEDWIHDFEECYAGEFWHEREFAEDLADQTGILHEMPENLRYYFDFDLFARDLLMGDYWSVDTYYFRSL